jgi:hypothetical protein
LAKETFEKNRKGEEMLAWAYERDIEYEDEPKLSGVTAQPIIAQTTGDNQVPLSILRALKPQPNKW